MRILLIDEEFPYPLNSGKRIRTFNLAKNLSKNNKLIYLAYGDINSDSFNFIRNNSIQPIAVKSPSRRQSGTMFYLKLIQNLFSQYPYIVTSHYTNRFQKKILQLLSEKKYDVIICETTPYAVFVKNIKKSKKIIVAHNIESSIWKRYEKYETNIFKKIYISIQRRKVEKFEKNCFLWVNGATAVSQLEAEELSKYSVNYSPTVIENGVDTNFFTETNNEIDLNQLVFTGSMDWRPNQDAVFYFVNEILPLIKQIKPDIKVTFVGRKPPKSIMELNKRDDISITGTVDDVRPYISNAAVYIVPLRIGGGSRLKILEAMAMNKAIVSTSVGAEGLMVVNGENIILADKPQDFSNSVIELINTIELRNKIANNGLKLVTEKYCWENISLKYENYLKEVISKK